MLNILIDYSNFSLNLLILLKNFFLISLIFLGFFFKDPLLNCLIKIKNAAFGHLLIPAFILYLQIFLNYEELGKFFLGSSLMVSALIPIIIVIRNLWSFLLKIKHNNSEHFYFLYFWVIVFGLYSLFLIVICFFFKIVLIRVAASVIFSSLYIAIIFFIFLYHNFFFSEEIEWTALYKKYLPLTTLAIFLLSLGNLILNCLSLNFLNLIIVSSVLSFNFWRDLYLNKWMPMILNAPLLFTFLRFSSITPLILVEELILNGKLLVIFNDASLGITRIRTLHSPYLNLAQSSVRLYTESQNSNFFLRMHDAVQAKDVSAYDKLWQDERLKEISKSVSRSMRILKPSGDSLEFLHMIALSHYYQEEYIITPASQIFGSESLYVVSPELTSEIKIELMKDHKILGKAKEPFIAKVRAAPEKSIWHLFMKNKVGELVAVELDTERWPLIDNEVAWRDANRTWKKYNLFSKAFIFPLNDLLAYNPKTGALLSIQCKSPQPEKLAAKMAAYLKEYPTEVELVAAKLKQYLKEYPGAHISILFKKNFLYLYDAKGGSLLKLDLREFLITVPEKEIINITLDHLNQGSTLSTDLAFKTRAINQILKARQETLMLIKEVKIAAAGNNKLDE